MVIYAEIAFPTLWLEWFNSWLADQGVQGSNQGLAASISEIRYSLLPIRNMTGILLKRRKSNTIDLVAATLDDKSIRNRGIEHFCRVFVLL